MSLVALITDFGERDYYVGALKGVLLTRAPQTVVVDVTHEVPSYDALHGAFILRQVWSWFPPDTVFLAVVDPGVGTERRVLAGRYDGRCVVAPDNGLVTLLHQDMPCDVVVRVDTGLTPQKGEAATFHGRDVMAPVAAELALGKAIGSLGEAVDDPVLLPGVIRPDVSRGKVEGHVLYVDRFGTLVTNIRRSDLVAAGGETESLRVSVGGREIGPIRTTFADVPAGSPLALLGSCDLLEIAVNQGKANQLFARDSVVVVSSV